MQFSADGYRLAMDAASITETLNIQINLINDAPEPTANKPALPTGLENTDYTIKASDLVAYFTDVEGDTITLKEDSLEATNGQLVNNNDGTFTFTPDANFAGEVQLSYEVLDGTPGTFSTGSYSFNILPVNDPPARTDTSGFDFSVTFTIDEDANTTSLGLTGVTYGPGGGSDESGQTLTYTITSAPDATLGTLLLADGTTTVSDGQTITATQLQGLQFKPAADANGNTSFSFSVTDSGTVESDGSISQSAASQELPSIELIQREIALSTDLSGEGTIGVKVTSKLGTTAAGTANPSQPYAYDTSSGLLLSTNSAIPADSPGALSSGSHKLLLNADGSAGFSIPAAETFAVARIVSTMGAATLSAAVNPPTAAGTDTVTGFSIYTTEPGSNAGDANTVRMYSFDEEGHLSGNAITLNGSDLTRAKIATRNDFNGGTNSGVVIDQKLTSDSTPAVTTSLNLSLYSTKAGDSSSLITTALTPDSDLSSAPASAHPYPTHQ